MSKRTHGRRKVILIGLDGLMPEQVERYRQDVPEIGKLLNDAFFSPAYASPYTDTAVNWNTIATGAWMGTHGVTSFFAHLPGMALGEMVPTFNSDLCEAEYFYHAAERQGKRCILINYPTAFPRVLGQGITIGGDGLVSPNWTVRHQELFSSEQAKRAKRIFLQAPGQWQHVPSSYEPIQEGIAYLDAQDELVWDAGGPHIIERTGADTGEVRHFLVFRDGGTMKLLMSSAKDASKATVVLSQGEWSGWVEEEWAGRKAWRQYKLVELSSDGTRVRLFGTIAGSPEGWGRPAGIEKRIIENVGPYVEGLDPSPVGTRDWFGSDVAAELRRIQADWVCDCAEHLAQSEDWDVLFVQFHCPDGENHYCLRDLESPDPAHVEWAEGYLREGVWTIFELVAEIRKRCADENTLVCVVSDHGSVPVYDYINLPGILMREGWARFDYDPERGVYNLDTKNSVCWSSHLGAFINLVGREKYGCVAPGEEYERLWGRIIDRYRAIKHPETGEHPFAFVARKEDLDYMGLCHERVEDVFTFLRCGYFYHINDGRNVSRELMAFWQDPRELIPVEETFGLVYSEGMRATHCQHPGAKCEYASNRAVFFLAGPGVRKGTRGDKVNLVDVAPTLAHYLGIKPPRHCDGRIVWEAFE